MDYNRTWGGQSARQSSDYSFSAGSSRNFQNTDSYDFDISGDDFSYSPPPQKARDSIQRTSSFTARSNVGTSQSHFSTGGTMRRASIEDRAKEILEKARSAAPRVSEESDSGPSLQATFAELMEGIEIPKDRQTMQVYDISSPKASSAFESKSAAQKRVMDTPGDSSYGDSFELSAADLEVGTFAAKRMREKSAERGRRMSFDQPNFKEQKELQTFAKKSAASPDPAKSRKSLGDFQISTALSSIQRSKSFTADPDFRGDFAKYGSLERSDDEIYKMLNVTGAQDSVASRSFLASSANSSFVDRGTARSAPTATAVSAKALAANSDAANKTNMSSHTQDSYSESEAFEDESREELLASPVPPQKLPSQAAQHHAHETDDGDADGDGDDDGYYDDDFEADVNVSSAAPPQADDLRTKPPASAPLAAVPAASTAEPPLAPSRPHALSADNNLNSVDEIMQRWYNADSNTLMKSLDDIGRSRSQSQDTHSVTAAAAKPSASTAAPMPAMPAVPRSSAPSPVEPAPALAAAANGSAATLDPLATDAAPAAKDAVGDVTVEPAVAGIALASQLDIPTWDDADVAALSDSSPRGSRYSAADADADNDVGNDDDADADNDVGNDDDADAQQRFSPTTVPAATGFDNDLSDEKREHWGRPLPARETEAPIDGQRDAGRSTSPEGSERSQRSEAKSRTRYSGSEQSQSDPDRSLDRSAGDEEDDEDLRRWRSRSRSKSPAATARVAPAASLAPTPMLASSTIAKINQKRRLKKSPSGRAAGPNEVGELRRQSSQVLRKVFQLQDELFTLKRSQSLERARQSQEPLRLSAGSGGELQQRSARSASQAARRSSERLRPEPAALAGAAPSTAAHDALSPQRSSPQWDNAKVADSLALLEPSQPLQSEEDWRRLKLALVAKAAELHRQQRDLESRRKILELREVALSEQERLANEGASQSEPRLAQALDGALQESATLRRQLEHCHAQLRDAHGANERLKAELFEASSAVVRSDGGGGGGGGEVVRVDAAEKQAREQLRLLALEALSRLTQVLPRPNQANGRRGAKSDAQAPAATETTIPVEKADYEALLRDYAAQDAIIAGFQRENERLMTQVREHEKSVHQQEARFYEEREALNKELNTLRHLASQAAHLNGSHAQHRLSLQQELDSDARSRALHDKVAELTQQLAETRRQAAVAQDSLRHEIAALQSDLSQFDPQHLLQLRRRLADREQELGELRPRLQRLLAQQQSADESDQELRRLRSQVIAMKQELVRRGLAPAQLKRLVAQAEASPLHELPLELRDNFEASATEEKLGGAGSARSFADIKRIRELENVVADLRDALRKRYPDSVASLIQATKEEDQALVREAERLRGVVRDLRQELDEQQRDAERKLQQLRIKHDSLRTQYDEQLRSLREQLQRDRNSDAREAEADGDGGEDERRTAKQLTIELARSRQFYQRKIEDLQRRHEAQLRSMKRGDVDSDTSNVSDSASSDATSAAGGTGASLAQAQQTVQQLTQRLALLEKELFEASETLGQSRADNARLRAQLESLSQEPRRIAAPELPLSPTPSLDPAAVEKLVEAQVAALAEDLRRKHAEEVRLMNQQQASTVASLRESLDRVRKERRIASDVRAEPAAGGVSDAEAQRLRDELAAEKKRSSVLLGEIMRLKGEVSAQPLKQSPLDANALLSHQVADLQRRIAVREHELTHVIAQAQAQARLERQRLELAHAAELRVKDEQLLQFRLELQQLVAALSGGAEAAAPVEGSGKIPLATTVPDASAEALSTPLRTLQSP